MKNLSIFFLSFLAFSCSQKDVEPDLTKDFIGLWKTELQTNNDREDVWTTYEIKRISNDLVKIDVKQYFDDKQGNYDDYVDEYAFDSVRVEPNNVLKINDSRTRGLGEITYNGKGVVVGDKLTFDLIIDYEGQNLNILSIIPTTRQ